MYFIDVLILIYIIHYTGPPETMREHIVAASNAMEKGNWKDYILNIKVLVLVLLIYGVPFLSKPYIWDT